ncbi:hypothetical protein HLH21_10540 [Gluconacetobacter johannae]|uniref:Uncharacterized protein n=1 Tax=Gluconacetobacter johannae TaxID=112140 RepID=A0A7W4J810_9PROT|nr:hypothetical protein [Gluconacetobacter johannae]MBB2176364.1 hypothetical protein [Gluconacetobacter johannae]
MISATGNKNILSLKVMLDLQAQDTGHCGRLGDQLPSGAFPGIEGDGAVGGVVTPVPDGVMDEGDSTDGAVGVVVPARAAARLLAFRSSVALTWDFFSVPLAI